MRIFLKIIIYDARIYRDVISTMNMRLMRDLNDIRGFFDDLKKVLTDT